MALQFSMKPTGWFHIAWSGEIPAGKAVPLKYFGKDLVAFRSEAGELAVLDAHCHHLGAHLGYGGKVQGDAVVCPYHGWQWNTQGQNTLIPYQDNVIRKPLRKWSIVERWGMVFMWHDPAGGPPREGWELPDIFTDFPEIPAVSAADFYPCWPDAVVDKPGEAVHPQMVQENLCDSTHFRHTHGAPLDPELLWFRVEGTRIRAAMGFKSPKTREIALRTYALNPSVGLSFFVFEGRFPYRLVLSATPVDEDTSHFRVSYFFPRDPASPDVMPEHMATYARNTEELYEEDARMWRHMKFKHRPIYAKQDIAGYTAMRKWSEQFYEAPAQLSPKMAERMADTRD
ncbi:MAG: Rieske 2Fe-2S domain-containing protein [Rubrivivax sp.]|nr:Rieske 2Fe-2S domain-containing protein [Rubrivivax sp.]